MATPDREAFLRRLEGGNNQNQEPHTPVDANDDTLRFLREAGLESTPIDPASLETLQQLVSPIKSVQQQQEQQLDQRDDEPLKPRAVAFNVPPSSPASPPLKEVETCANRDLRRLTSEITLGTVNDQTQEGTNVSVAGSSEEVSTNKLILQQLEMQTAMIMDMQQRIDHLTNMVHNMQGGMPPQQTPFAYNVPPQAPPQAAMPYGYAGPPPPMATPAGQVLPEHPPVIQPRALGLHQQQPLAPPRRSLFGLLCDWFTGLQTRVRASRTAELWRVFWALHRRYVRLDGGLIFKVILVVTVFSAKTMSRKARKDDFWSPSVKFQLVTTLVFVGFIIQTGYAVFFYRFFVKERFLERIYGGEDIDVDQINWQDNNARRGQRGRDNHNLRNMIMPRNNLLAGNIPEPPRQARNGLSVVVDIAVLFGSFLLSVLPMWKPEGGPEARAQRDAIRAAQNQAPPPAAEDQPPPPPQQQQQAIGGPNEVAPPQDLDQFAADDDDDEEEEPHAHQD